MGDEAAFLHTAVDAFIERGLNLSRPTALARPTGGALSERHLAEALAASREVTALNQAATTVATSNGYGIRTDHAGVVSAGRRLDDEAIIDTGIARWLMALAQGASVPSRGIVTDAIADFLAGAPIPLIRYVGLDADIVLRGGSVNVAGWELAVTDRDELRDLQPLPPLLDFAPAKVWDPDTWQGSAFLRRVEPDATPTFGRRFYLGGALPELAFWAPLLVLSCYKNEVVTVWSDHIVEPRRHVGTRLDRVWYDTIGGEDWTAERPMSASLGIEPQDEPMFRRFCLELSIAIDLSDTSSKRARVLERAARRFLRSSEHSVVRPEPYEPHRKPDAIAGYVACLESLVAPDASSGEIARKVSQRTAVLIGKDDEHRLRVADETKRAYRARSSWAHGDDIKEKDRPDLGMLRDTVRRVLIAWIAITAHGIAPADFGDACDDALLSASARESFLEPVTALRGRVADGGALAPRPAVEPQ